MTDLLETHVSSPGPRLASRVSRPSRIERVWAAFVVFYLTVGFPPEWFNPPVDGSPTGSESALVAVAYIAVASPLLVFLIGNLHVAWAVLARTRYLFALHALMVLSVLWAVDPGLTLRRSAGLVLTLAVAVHLVTRFSQAEIVRTLAVALFAGILVNLGFVAAFPELSQAFEARSNRNVITGVFTNKNSFGQMNFLAVFVFAVAARTERRYRVFWYGAIVLAGLLLLQSESRTALATAVMGVALLALFQLFRSRKTLFGAALLTASGFAVGTAVFIISNLEFVTESTGRDASLSGRVPLWETVINEIPERLILGTGWSGFWNGWFSPAHDVWLLHGWLPPSAHNQLLDFITQLGVIGGVVGVLLFGRAIWRGIFVAQFVSGIDGLWPLGVVSIAAIYSVTETLVNRSVFWMVTMVAILLIDQPRPEIDRRSRSLRTRRSSSADSAAVGRSRGVTIEI